MEIEDYQEGLKKIEEKIKDALENLGDIEYRDALYQKAEYMLQYGYKDDSIEIFELVLKKSISISKKLEVIFKELQIYFQQKNIQKLYENIQRCHKYLESGGDWEKKNKLKVYEGLYLILVRDFSKAANLFLDSIATFSSSEIISFNELVKYTILLSIISINRQDIKKKLIHSPEILSCIKEMPQIKSYLESFYKCDYKSFFIAFNHVIQELNQDYYLGIHKKFYIQSMRVVVYQQFLESYKTVTVSNMAKQFGVSESFIDKEISGLVAIKKLNCKIDMVQGLIQSERVEQRENQFQSCIKQGDMVLNQIQKLARAINI